ncbi:MAG: MATE family efflux transporter [Eubacterium sp.]|nr:MATE family efflux transporter [Eubacterium sp.]
MKKNASARSVSKRRDIDMLHGSLADKILLFTLPLAVTGILQQLFNATDVAIVGQLVGSDAMAAVGSNAPVIGLLVNLFVGVSLGANVVISRCTGMGNQKAISRGVHTAILVSLISGALLAVFGTLVSRPLLTMMGVPDQVFPMALSYLRIYMAGMPLILLYNYESAIFRSQGDTRTPLFCLIVAGGLNIGLNIFFIRVFHMTADGVALATVISNGVSALLLFFFLLRSETATRIRFSEFRIDRSLLRQMMAIGLPAGLQGMMFSLSNMTIQSSINSLGPAVMAACSAAFNLEILLYFPINAFGQACTTFIGQNIGAGQKDRCKLVIRYSLLMGLVISAVLSVLMLLFRMPALRLFNSQEEVLAYGAQRLLIIIPFEALDLIMEIFSGTLRGFGHSMQPALLSLFGICGVRIIWVHTWFKAHPTFFNLMAIYPASWVITAAILVICYFLMRKKLYA